MSSQTRGFFNSIEWPTLAVFAICYLLFGLASYFWLWLPAWLVFPVLIYAIALHGSLQHEVLHGHPTRARWFNELLIAPSLWVFFPYYRYKKTHLQHHNDERLTDPLDDPESYYIPRAYWAKKPWVNRRLLNWNNSFVGRMVIGPILGSYVFYRCELREILRGSAHHIRAWAYHLFSCALVFGWVSWVCGMPIWVYLLFVVYPGVAVSLIRSFLEHRAAEDPNHRTVVVEASPFWSFLFLNNNLHAVHHEYPAKPWYALPKIYRERRDHFLTKNDGYLLDGYKEVALKYAFKQKEPVAHPIMRTNEPYNGDRP